MSNSRDSEKRADPVEAHSGMREFWEGEIEYCVKGLDVVEPAFSSSTEEAEADGTL